MIRNPYGHSSKNPRRLHFPVPEDIFASEDQVAERHERDIRSPAIDQAIDDWNLAKEAGDEHGLRTAATAIVNATSAAFKLQGVPTFAHPVLPPQFVKAEAPGFAHVSKGQRNALVTELLDKFDPSVKPSGLQQFAQRLIGRLPRDARSDGEINSEEPSPFVTAQAQPPQPYPQGPGHPPRQQQPHPHQRPNQPPGLPGQPPGAGQPQQARPPEWWEQPLLPAQPNDPPLRKSQSNNLVAPTNRLDPRLRAYLGSLDWYDPTDNVPRGADNQGGGGFKGTRRKNGVQYPHGAQDRLSQPDQSIRAPVTGRFLGHGRLNNGWPYFDIELDHGVMVRVIHSEVARDAANNVYLRSGDTIRAGQEIGTQQQFGGNLRNVPVHVHLQIMVPIPNSSPPRHYLVDPAPYVPNPDYVP